MPFCDENGGKNWRFFGYFAQKQKKLKKFLKILKKVLTRKNLCVIVAKQTLKNGLQLGLCQARTLKTEYGKKRSMCKTF